MSLNFIVIVLVKLFCELKVFTECNSNKENKNILEPSNNMVIHFFSDKQATFVADFYDK